MWFATRSTRLDYMAWFSSPVCFCANLLCIRGWWIWDLYRTCARRAHQGKSYGSAAHATYPYVQGILPISPFGYYHIETIYRRTPTIRPSCDSAVVSIASAWYHAVLSWSCNYDSACRAALRIPATTTVKELFYYVLQNKLLYGRNRLATRVYQVAFDLSVRSYQCETPPSLGISRSPPQLLDSDYLVSSYHIPSLRLAYHAGQSLVLLRSVDEGLNIDTQYHCDLPSYAQ